MLPLIKIRQGESLDTWVRRVCITILQNIDILSLETMKIKVQNLKEEKLKQEKKRLKKGQE